MATITVNELKQYLQEAIDTLEGFEGEQEIQLATSTYFLGHPRAFIGIGGSQGGFLDLNDIESRINVDEDDE